VTRVLNARSGDQVRVLFPGDFSEEERAGIRAASRSLYPPAAENPFVTQAVITTLQYVYDQALASLEARAARLEAAPVGRARLTQSVTGGAASIALDAPATSAAKFVVIGEGVEAEARRITGTSNGQTLINTVLAYAHAADTPVRLLEAPRLEAIWFGVVADGATNDNLALNRAATQLGNLGVKAAQLDLPAGDIRLGTGNQNVTFPADVAIRVTGRGMNETTLYNSAPSGSPGGLRFTNARMVALEDFRVVLTTTPDLEAQNTDSLSFTAGFTWVEGQGAAISIAGTTKRALLRNVRTFGGGNGVIFSPAAGVTMNEVALENCVITHSYGFGGRFRAIDALYLSNVRAQYCGNDGIKLEQHVEKYHSQNGRYDWNGQRVPADGIDGYIGWEGGVSINDSYKGNTAQGAYIKTGPHSGITNADGSITNIARRFTLFEPSCIANGSDGLSINRSGGDNSQYSEGEEGEGYAPGTMGHDGTTSLGGLRYPLVSDVIVHGGRFIANRTGIYIRGRRCVFYAPRVMLNLRQGILMTTAFDITLRDAIIVSNSRQNAGQFPGIQIGNAGDNTLTRGIHVVGGVIDGAHWDWWGDDSAPGSAAGQTQPSYHRKAILVGKSARGVLIDQVTMRRWTDHASRPVQIDSTGDATLDQQRHVIIRYGEIDADPESVNLEGSRGSTCFYLGIPYIKNSGADDTSSLRAWAPLVGQRWGTTANRPALGQMTRGQSYFDQTKRRHIWADTQQSAYRVPQINRGGTTSQRPSIAGESSSHSVETWDIWPNSERKSIEFYNGTAWVEPQLVGELLYAASDSVAHGDVWPVTVTVTGAAMGDTAIGGSDALPAGWRVLAATVVAANTVVIDFINRTGGASSLPQATAHARVFKR
jgi:hypothetical protein